jgi:hypothetical protein
MVAQRWVGLGLLGTVVVVGAALALLPRPGPLPLASAQEFEGQLTAPQGEQPFGGAAVGTYMVEVRGNRVEVRATLDQGPASGQVHEGWLVDPQTGYKLSLGLVEGGSLRFEQAMVNPWTYGMLVITSEPAGDADPNPAQPVGGAMLQAPFGA